MQTPLDRRHWTGSPLRQRPSDDDLRDAAGKYIKRCYQVGLEVIGITDHNLGTIDEKEVIRFFKFLADEANLQEADYGYRIRIFPGFEVEAQGTGKIHIVCLFDLSTSVGEASHALSGLGLPPSGRFRNGRPQPTQLTLFDVLEKVYPPSGLVIAVHAERDGVLDDHRVSEDWQKEIIKNEDLLCIELPHPRDYYHDHSGKIGAIIRNDDPEWHRSHPIAVVNSSDCKRLDELDGQGEEGWIGRRFTWIKMGEPSIEGLRQAFLDHESRIRFGEIRPEDRESYPLVEKIKISGVAFLDDQELLLSPNLNTIIGGGGTGKSTIIEYLRAAFDQHYLPSPDVNKNHAKAVASLGSGHVEFTPTGR
ncbi:MAG: AAA family ATPase [Ferrimicrobium sp.]